MERLLISQTPEKAGEKVKVAGWVSVRRAHGKIVFIDLRDRSGILQCVFLPSNKEACEAVVEIRPEWVVELMGEVVKRPDKMVNAEISTGTVELVVESVNVLSKAETLPFDIDTDGMEINEEVRMKYRSLDLRRERLKTNLIMRHKVSTFVRNFLTNEGFIVYKGSTANAKPSEAVLKKSWYTNVRDTLLRLGHLKNVSDEKYEFVQDFLFRSPSGASGLVLGLSSSGWLHWKDEKGRTLEEIEAKRLKAS